jgi:uncharacterized protein YxjI
MSFRKKLLVLDGKKQEVARIKQKFLAFTPTFFIFRNGRLSATVKKRRFKLREQFTIDIPGASNYRIVGDFVGYEYSIKRNADDIARISKRFFAMSDSYGVEVYEGDTLLLLCAAVIIDLVLHNAKDRAD